MNVRLYWSKPLDKFVQIGSPWIPKDCSGTLLELENDIHYIKLLATKQLRKAKNIYTCIAALILILSLSSVFVLSYLVSEAFIGMLPLYMLIFPIFYCFWSKIINKQAQKNVDKALSVRRIEFEDHFRQKFKAQFCYGFGSGRGIESLVWLRFYRRSNERELRLLEEQARVEKRRFVLSQTEVVGKWNQSKMRGEEERVGEQTARRLMEGIEVLEIGAERVEELGSEAVRGFGLGLALYEQILKNGGQETEGAEGEEGLDSEGIFEDLGEEVGVEDVIVERKVRKKVKGAGVGAGGKIELVKQPELIEFQDVAVGRRASKNDKN